MKYFLVFLFAVTTLAAQTGSERLRFVVIVSRHGVRSPTGKAGQLSVFSSQPWPKWSVPPGYLTEHGARLITLFGAYDKLLLTQEGLLGTSGCEDAQHTSVVADSDQRTRETGRALAEGMFPGCPVSVQALAEGTDDSLFHPLNGEMAPGDRELAAAAVAGRIGGNPGALMEVYRPQLEMMDAVLGDCPSSPCEPKPGKVSLLGIPGGLRAGSGDHLVDLKGPLSTSSTFAENFLLEYTEGMDASQVGWGHVDDKKLRRLLELHTAQLDLVDRTPFIARAQASAMLQRVLASMQQSVRQQPVAGALGKPGDRLLILAGHDTNIASIAGALNLSWLADGRLNDAPPGGALVFELWSEGKSGDLSVRVFYMCQTLEQMRAAKTLTFAAPPERVPVFVPGCGTGDGSCRWSDFASTVGGAINPAYVR